MRLVKTVRVSMSVESISISSYAVASALEACEKTHDVAISRAAHAALNAHDIYYADDK